MLKLYPGIDALKEMVKNNVQEAINWAVENLPGYLYEKYSEYTFHLNGVVHGAEDHALEVVNGLDGALDHVGITIAHQPHAGNPQVVGVEGVDQGLSLVGLHEAGQVLLAVEDEGQVQSAAGGDEVTHIGVGHNGHLGGTPLHAFEHLAANLWMGGRFFKLCGFRVRGFDIPFHLA